MRSGAAVICLALVVTCLGAAPGGAEIIADYQGTSVYSGFADSGHTTGQAFELIGGATATEIQLLLSRNEPGDTGSAVVELRRADANNYGRPSATAVATVSVPITDVPHGWQDGAKWLSFNLSPSVYLDPPASGPNRWWIVLKEDGLPGQMQIHWPAGTSGYGTGDDCMPSDAAATTWTDMYVMDCNFKVFGTRSPLSTNMTVTVDPEPIAKNGKTNVSVVVKDSYDNLVPGMGTVHWNAPDGGTFRCSWCSLVDGEASNEWTAPADSTGTYTVEVTFDAWSYSGYDYSSTSGSAEIHVLEPNRPTTGALGLAPPIVNTRGQTDVTFGPVQYWDPLQGKSVNVPGGSVSFSCDTEGAGTFTANSAAVGTDGIARTKWTAKNLVDSFNLTGAYGGYQQGSYIYGPCSGSSSVVVQYTNVVTNLPTVKVSPDYPYVGKGAWVSVEIKEQVSGNLVPCGKVTLSADAGSFGASGGTIVLDMAGGTVVTYWTAPSVETDPVAFTAGYQGAYGGGNFYLPGGPGTAMAHVIKDHDTDGGKMTWLAEYTTEYSWWRWGWWVPDLPEMEDTAKGFGNGLTAHGWEADGSGSDVFGNDHAWQKDFMGDSELDQHDFTFYGGHGNPDCITFNNSNDDDELEAEDAYDSWGDEDAEWVALQSCQVLSDPGEWAKCMRGLHLLCGFRTNAPAVGEFGGALADLLCKDNYADEAHTVVQAWFLACDETMRTDYTPGQRVIRPKDPATNTFDDYIWGEGRVLADPAHIEGYEEQVHDWTQRNRPIADGGGGPSTDYYVTAGDELELDGSGSTDADSGDYLTYVWDLDTTTDTDTIDWDNDPTTSLDDDGDAFGPRPRCVFSTVGDYYIRVIVRDSQWSVSPSFTGTATVHVQAPGLGVSGTAAQPKRASDGELEIVDRFEPGSLPTEAGLPTFRTVMPTVGYNEMTSIANYYGMKGLVGLNESGNWNMVRGSNELTVNQNSGGVAYLDRSRAYRYTHTPSSLPDEQTCMVLADYWLGANGISSDGVIMGRFTDVYFQDGMMGGREPTSSIPFQRHVNYRRTFNVGDVLYPAVGPGGKFIVMLDDTGDVGMFMKIWREAEEEAAVPLRLATDAVADFHRLGPAAVIYDSLIPRCKRILVDNVRIGYYEDGFVTRQNRIYPVYVLNLTCQDEQGSQEVEVYLPAVSAPVEVSIASPRDGFPVKYGETVDFEGSATGGTSPYTYEWFSDVDGLLGVGSSISTTLSDSQREGQILRHRVTLRVTDDNGLSAVSNVTIPVLPLAVAELRKLDLDSPVWLFDGVVSADFHVLGGDIFYLESDDESFGIRVDKPGHALSNGMRANVTGVLKVNSDRERYIDADWAAQNGTGTVDPLGMNNRTLGGGTDGLQEGVKDGTGLNNIGLLVTAFGRFTYLASHLFTLDDGSGVGVKCFVETSQPTDPGWGYVAARGVSSCKMISGELQRFIRVQSWDDVMPL